MTGIERAIRAAGTQEALAAICGVTQPAVSKWVKWGHAPQSQVLLISRRTGVPVRELVSPSLRKMMGA